MADDKVLTKDMSVILCSGKEYVLYSQAFKLKWPGVCSVQPIVQSGSGVTIHPSAHSTGVRIM